MKKRLLIFGLFLLFSICIYSQNTVLVGDTVILKVIGSNGNIQWQQSEDSVIWSDIYGLIDSVETTITTSSTTGEKYYRAKITNTSICENSPWYSNIIKHKIITNTSELEIGDNFHKCIVFYLDNLGNGLMAPQVEGPWVGWGCRGTTTGATNTTVGASNTASIVAACHETPIAASVCDTLTMNNYNDWYLPAKDELNYLYLQKNLVGGFSNIYTGSPHWTSSEYDANKAWFQYINDDSGYQNTELKDYSGGLVRCIRAYSQNETISNTTHSVTEVTEDPITITLSTQPNSQIKCIGSSVTFSISANGTSPINYQWKKGGVTISNATNASYTISNLTIADEGIYTCEVSNLCKSITSSNAELKVVELSVNAGTDVTICNGETIQLQTIGNSNHLLESGTLNYSWSPSIALTNPNIFNPIANPIINTAYTVTVTDQLGCNKTGMVNVNVSNVYQNQTLCIVGVSTTNKNLLVWDKPISTAIDSFYIYRETNVTNIYEKIGAINYDTTSIFVDYNSYPDIQSNKYKISVIDTCGNESNLSSFHKTMHLAINQGVPPTWNLIWDSYDGFTVSTYNVYRGTDANNLQLIGTSSGSNTQYSDFSAPSGYVYYQVEIVSPNLCNPSKSYNTSRSNKVTNNPQGINEILNDNYISVYPNPAENEIIIEILQNIKTNRMTCEITNTEGQIIRKIIINEKKNRVNIKELNSGFYTVKVKSDKGIMIKKMIKQ